MDLSKLTPAPWKARSRYTDYGNRPPGWGVLGVVADVTEAGYLTKDDAEFIALARNAFDVMMRRGWSARVVSASGDLVKWAVVTTAYTYAAFADPFTALVEADKWYKANVEGKP